ncbi:MAG: hypothetical protein M3327_03025 [Actinomycetota bacterium]|nr:hypothetical protein [Actinomycetota bacterium]
MGAGTQYRRVGKWGLKVPEISLGLWPASAAPRRSGSVSRRRRLLEEHGHFLEGDEIDAAICTALS